MSNRKDLSPQQEAGERIVHGILFYFATLVMLGILAAFVLPSAEVLRHVGARNGEGKRILFPLLTLPAIWFYGFWRARKLMKSARRVPAYGWLMGVTALAVMLLWSYLSTRV